MRALAKRYGVNPTTVQKWRKRTTTTDGRMGPKEPRSTVLTVEAEAIIVALRRHTLLALDDCLYGLQPTIPHLTRSSLHRCLERHGISRLPDVDGDKPKKQRFASYAIGYVHIDMAEVSTAEGKLRLFVTIDRTSKFVFVRLVESAGKMEAAQFLREVIEAVPYPIHTVLTDNGIQFTFRRWDVWSRAEVARIDLEPVWVFGPGLTDGLERGVPAQGLEMLGDVVGCDEGQDMRLQALQIVVMEDLDGRVLRLRGGRPLIVRFMRSA